MLKMRTVFYCWVMSIAVVVALSRLDHATFESWKVLVNIAMGTSMFLIWYFLMSIMFSFGAIIGIFKAPPKNYWTFNYYYFFIFFTKEARQKMKLDIETAKSNGEI